VADARERGARIYCGGTRSDCGRYFLPTLITEVPGDARILHEEIFGPVVTLAGFQAEAEAVAVHNGRDCGLSSAVFTRDPARIERLVRALDTGCVNINNVMLTEGNAGLPFGGVKYSGYGRMKGEAGLLGMTRPRAVLVDGSSAPLEPNWYPYSAEKLGLMGRLLDALVSRGPAKLWRLALAGLGIELWLRRHKG
jgi:acyl-CoA reductase-like NAD-dependent aldehyde dehydrogenase